MPKHNLSKKDFEFIKAVRDADRKVLQQAKSQRAAHEKAAQEAAKAEQEKAAQEAAKAEQEKAAQEAAKAEQEKAAQEAAKDEQEKAEQEDTALDQDFDLVSDDGSDDAFGQPFENGVADFTKRENETGTKTQTTQVANGSQSLFSSIAGFFGMGKQVAENADKQEQVSSTSSSLSAPG